MDTREEGERLVKLVVFSHKPCWQSSASRSGYATDGGFPFQMRALSELFNATTVLVPCSSSSGNRDGEIPLTGYNLSIVPLTHPWGNGIWRKIGLLFWFLRNSPGLFREIRRADAVHTPIPGDIGTLGMLLAWLLRKPLFVRHCGNWFVQRTAAERFWKWFMERFAGGRNVMLATGGAEQAPSQRNPAVRWIFSTSLTEQELEAYATPRRILPSGQPRLIIVCRQEKEKGTGVLLESLSLLVNDFPQVKLDVVGDGRAFPEFNRQAEDLGVSRYVTFYGQVSHEKVLELLRQADLFCYPTASEGFPKVVLEALACGLPVVTTRVSVLPQLIANGCGVVMDKVTPEVMAQAVKDILSAPDHYRAMSAKAVQTGQQYSLERWRGTIGELLQAAWGALRDDA